MTEAATRRHHLPGTPCWASLMVRDLSRTRDFYRGLFGWDFRTGPQQMGPYVRALLDGREVAGLGEVGPGRQLRIAWMPYLASDDADATAELIRVCGGTVAVGPLDAEEAGRMAIAADPAGASFGVWQGREHVGVRSSVLGAPGTPVWFELVARETASVGKFYPAVFGYEAEAVAPDEGDYLELRLEERVRAAIHGLGSALPRDEAPHWETCFAVADTDVAVARVEELGGHTVRRPWDSALGRRATVTDPEGARFDLVTWRGGSH